MEKEEKKSLLDRIWDAFASVKLAVIIFGAISLTSVVGTVIEQQAAPERNLKILGQLFGESAAPTLYRILEGMGFMNMYHSWWFVALLVLFAANLIICSLDRLPRIMKLVREHVRALPPEHLDRMSIRRMITVKGKAAELKDLSFSALREAGFKNIGVSEGKGVQLYAEKGNYTRLGVYITHLSVLVIFGGAIIGGFLGFSGFLNLPEGSVSAVAYKDQGVEIPLGFEIRLDNFEVEFYEQTDMPKKYLSWLTILKNGREVMRKMIEVNDPLKFEGVTFYQASYGPVPNGMMNGIVVLRALSGQGKAQQFNLRLGESFTIPDTSVAGRITDFSPALAMDQGGRVFTYNEQVVNPAIQIEFTEGGKTKFSGWILKRYPQTWILPDGNRVEFLDYWGVEYTGLQVRKDPGVYLVYLGCIIMSIGLYITFFMSHRRIWVNITEEKNTAQIIIGASANRNRAAFERKIEKVAAVLSTGHKGGK